MPVRGYYGGRLRRRYVAEIVATRYDQRLKRTDPGILADPPNIAASSGQSASVVSSIPTSLPTGTTTGDLVMIVVGQGNVGSAGFTASGWTTDYAALNTGDAGGYSYGVLWRVIQAGDTAPTITSTDTGKYSWAAITVHPSSGGVLSLDGTKTSQVDTATATSHTPPARTTANTDVSLILASARNSALIATGSTVTPPAGWTVPNSGQSTTGSGTLDADRQVVAAVMYQAAQTGTITPGPVTLSQTGYAETFHYLVFETVTATAVFVPQSDQPRRPWGAVIRRGRPVYRDTQALLDAAAPPAGQARRGRGVAAARRGRAPTPVPGQAVLPVGVFVPQALQPRRLRGWWQRRRLSTLLPDQVTGMQPGAQPRRPRGLTARRTRPSGPLPAQSAIVPPAYPGAVTVQPRRVRALFPRRRAQPLPANQAGPVAAAPKRLRGALARRGRPVNIVTTQAAPTPPAYPGAATSQPRRLRGLLARRGRMLFPPPTQSAPQPPAYVPQASTARRLRGLLLPRGRRAVIPGAHTHTPGSVAVRRPRGVKVRRGRQTLPVQTQVAPVNPALPLQRPQARQVKGLLRRRRPVTVPPGQGVPVPFTRGRVRVALRRRKIWRIPVLALSVTGPGFGAVSDTSAGAALTVAASAGLTGDAGSGGATSSSGATGQIGDTPTGKGSL